MRKPRKYSESGVYHVVIRGVNKQNIFYDDADRNIFISLLKRYSKKLKVRIIAYCLMDNHVHLEFYDEEKNISLFMQCLCSLYARFFNRKYDRIGHLFADRYLSEVIKDKKYLLAVFRYILQNPYKAGICNICDYKWSSYKCYRYNLSFIDKRMILENFNSIDNLYEFINTYTCQDFMEIEMRPSERERNYIDKIMKLLKSDSPIINPDLPIDDLNLKLRKLKIAKLSIRTISRITGISKYLVQKA